MITIFLLYSEILYISYGDEFTLHSILLILYYTYNTIHSTPCLLCQTYHIVDTILYIPHRNILTILCYAVRVALHMRYYTLLHHTHYACYTAPTVLYTPRARNPYNTGHT